MKVRHDFLRYCPHFVDAMQSAFPRLENFVHVENRLSIRWLKHLGFTVDEEMPEVMNGEDFLSVLEGSGMREPVTAVVRQISVAEAFANQAFPALCREYAAEAAIAGLPVPREKAVRIPSPGEASGSDVFCLYGAFLGDELIGFVVLLTPVLPHYGAAIAVAESLFVGGAHRKTGAGMLLIRRAEKRAREVRSPGMLFSAPSGGRLSVLLPRIGYRKPTAFF